MELAGFNYTTTFGTRDFDPDLVDETTNFFKLYLLTPNSYPDRITWAQMLEQELPKIGIYVGHHAIEEWDYIFNLVDFLRASYF